MEDQDVSVKTQAWEEFYRISQDELDTLVTTGKEAVAETTAKRARLKTAPVIKEFKVSYTILGNKKAHDRVWKNPTIAELTSEIPQTVTRAVKSIVETAHRNLALAPTPIKLQRFWKAKIDKAQSKVAYGMQMTTNARKGRAVPMPPMQTPRPLPVVSINENTNLDPKHEPGETS